MHFCIMILVEVYGVQGMECGSLKIIRFHKHIGNVTLLRYDFVSVGMALIDEVLHCGDEL